MQVPSLIYLMLIMTVTISNCSSSILIKAANHLPPSNQQQEVQESRISGHHQQNFQTQPQQKVKYTTLQHDTLSRPKNTGTDEDLHLNGTSVSRTFGIRHRLKLAIPLIMYKLGIATSMLGVLILLTAKSLLVGIIILIIQLSTGFAKLATVKKEKEHHESWDQESTHEKPPQNVHVHVHGIGGSGYHKPSYSYSHSPYSAWSKSDLLSANSRIEEDYYQRLKELKELKELRESLYTQVI